MRLQLFSYQCPRLAGVLCMKYRPRYSGPVAGSAGPSLLLPGCTTSCPNGHGAEWSKHSQCGNKVQHHVQMAMGLNSQNTLKYMHYI